MASANTYSYHRNHYQGHTHTHTHTHGEARKCKLGEKEKGTSQPLDFVHGLMATLCHNVWCTEHVFRYMYKFFSVQVPSLCLVHSLFFLVVIPFLTISTLLLSLTRYSSTTTSCHTYPHGLLHFHQLPLEQLWVIHPSLGILVTLGSSKGVQLLLKMFNLRVPLVQFFL